MTWSLALAILLTVGWIPVYVCRAEAIVSALPAYDRNERWWVPLTPVVITVHMSAACAILCVRPELPRWRAVLAAAVFVAALAFWFWGRIAIGPLRVRRLPDDPPLRFRCDGAFGVVRNPMYFGYVTAIGAPLIAVPERILLISFALGFAALAMRTVREERRLHAQLGPAYATYCRRVKRLVPYVW